MYMKCRNYYSPDIDATLMQKNMKTKSLCKNKLYFLYNLETAITFMTQNISHALLEEKDWNKYVKLLKSVISIICEQLTFSHLRKSNTYIYIYIYIYFSPLHLKHCYVHTGSFRTRTLSMSFTAVSPHSEQCLPHSRWTWHILNEWMNKLTNRGK